ncbi:MAG: glycerol-3-phosphate 1-O-acyltransferase PlsY [Candidatus Riflebacteria bacterium]|nr:glycerol-3-phosphate 1-O-acyltransferase PlsY [Candidatus Riflebacteria bacterium]
MTVSALIAGYLLGSVPASFLVARWGFGVDLRTVGSGNVGATNALRALGPKAGIPALVLDALKGTLAVLVARWIAPAGGLLGPLGIQLGCGVAAVLGHTFTIFLGFKGGKGVATGAGVFAALAPGPFLASLIVFIGTVVATRWVSLGSILGAVTLPVWIVLLATEGRATLLSMAVPLALFIVWRHRENLHRMKCGTESRISWGGAQLKATTDEGQGEGVRRGQS